MRKCKILKEVETALNNFIDKRFERYECSKKDFEYKPIGNCVICEVKTPFYYKKINNYLCPFCKKKFFNENKNGEKMSKVIKVKPEVYYDKILNCHFIETICPFCNIVNWYIKEDRYYNYKCFCKHLLKDSYLSGVIYF